MDEHILCDENLEATILEKFLNAVSLNAPQPTSVPEDSHDPDTSLSIAHQDAEIKAPEIPELKLSTITLCTSINRRVNLAVLKSYMKPSSEFTTADTSTVKRKKRVPNTKGVSLETESTEESGVEAGKFNNQITLYHHDPNYDTKLNLKVFSNGSIILTGCQETEKRPFAALQNLMPLLYCDGEVSVNIPPVKDLTKYLTKDGAKWTKPMASKIKVFNEIARCVALYMKLDVPTRLDKINMTDPLVFNEQTKKHLMLIFTVHKVLYIYCNDDQEYLSLYDDLISKAELLSASISKAELLSASISKPPIPGVAQIRKLVELFQIVCDGWDGSTKFTFHLPSYINFEGESPLNYDKTRLKIGLINTGMKIPMHIDREKCVNLINTKYEIAARYDPDFHQGVQVHYKSDKTCMLHNPHAAKKLPHRYVVPFDYLPKSDNACDCITVTVIIFREGSVMITGAKNWKQVDDAYHWLKDFILKEYKDISCQYNSLLAKGTSLNANHSSKGQFSAILHGDIVYLNKNELLSKPRNYIVIKKLDLLNAYR
jgi:hypothetical protein